MKQQKDNNIILLRQVREIFKNKPKYKIFIEKNNIFIQQGSNKINLIWFKYRFDELTPLSNTCSMEELYDLDSELENAYDELYEYYDINISKDIFIKLNALVTNENTLIYKRAVIHNCIKNSLAHKFLSKLKFFKKVFEYEGNGGVIYTYMWKRK